MKLSVIIPNYNGSSLLKSNLQKVVDIISAQSSNDFELVIIDDGSKDDSLEIIHSLIGKFDKKVKPTILENKINQGFAKSVNKAVDKASGDILLLLNTDVIPEKVFLDPLLTHFGDEKVFAVGCMDKSVERGKIVLRGRGIGKWTRGFLMHGAGDIEKTNTLWVNGGSGAFRREDWIKLGGFNDLLSPFYWEDVDLGYRALKSGYKLVFEPRSVVIHEHEKGSIRSSFSPAKVKEIAYRNQFIFVWDNVTDFSLVLTHIINIPIHLVAAILRGDILFLRGFFKALLLLPLVLQKRNKYNQFFSKTDAEVVRDLKE